MRLDSNGFDRNPEWMNMCNFIQQINQMNRKA